MYLCYLYVIYLGYLYVLIKDKTLVIDDICIHNSSYQKIALFFWLNCLFNFNQINYISASCLMQCKKGRETNEYDIENNFCLSIAKIN